MSAPRIGVTGVTRNVSGADRVTLNAAYPLAVLRSGGIPLGTLSLILLSLLAGGLLFCWLAARLALTSRITTALRHE